MSNPLSVRRVVIQTVDQNGVPDGKPSYGVMAADDYIQAYNDQFESLDDLNKAIDEAGSIIAVADRNLATFPEADPVKIGKDNFYGKDWMAAAWSDDEDDEDDDDDGKS